MKRTEIILAASLLILCAAGCNKDKPAVTDAPDIQFGMRISDPTGTKALLESADLLTTGTQVQVYGFATDDLAGHKSDGTAGTTKLNSGQTIQYGSDKWSFVNNNNELYQWIYNQPYKFFGWLAKDAKPSTALTASDFFGTGFAFNASTNVLNIPAKTLGINANNFDFAYSDIVARSATAADYSTVELSLNHLFASFSISATNYSTKEVTIKGIELHGLQDGKSATIDYSGNDVAVTYTGGNVTNPTLLSTSLTLAAAGSTGDAKADIVGTPSNTPTYFLVWPQTDLTYNGTTDGSTPPVITPTTSEDSNEPYLKIPRSEELSD